MTPPASSRRRPRSNRARAQHVADEVFGHRSLLPGQEEAMRALLDGHDVLLIAPTGAGKSLTYQVAGVLLEGCTVVVSPLLALQRDQIEGLAENGSRARAARISSAESETAKRETLDRARAGELEFLFLSPEQLANDEVREEVAALEPSLVAVDEAHCVSAWGHDFRPDYFRLGELIDELGDPRVVALTATAAPPVRDDIVDRLRLQEHRLVVTGFERPNLHLDVLRCADADEQQQVVLDTVAEADGSGIVYCRTRRATEEYADLLAGQGRRTVAYHAGLGKKRRAEAYERFMADEVDTIVATSAFGMGIDKPDIRFVVHAQAPESPDTYYQEVGRAGRDGEPATGTLVYRPEDLSLGRFFTGGVPKPADAEAVLRAVDEAGSTDPDDVRAHCDLGPRKVGRILNLLDQVAGPYADDPPAREALPQAVVDRAEAHKRLQHSRVEMMRGYAETGRCRAEYLLSYFGEQMDHTCGVCDNCRAGSADPPETDDEDYPLQSRVRHEEFGAGTVTDLEEDRITVLFEEVGYRTLARDHVREQGLLEPQQ